MQELNRRLLRRDGRQQACKLFDSDYHDNVLATYGNVLGPSVRARRTTALNLAFASSKRQEPLTSAASRDERFAG